MEFTVHRHFRVWRAKSTTFDAESLHEARKIAKARIEEAIADGSAEDLGCEFEDCSTSAAHFDELLDEDFSVVDLPLEP